MIVRMRASAEFQINAHTNKKQTAIKHVPEPSPLYHISPTGASPPYSSRSRAPF